MASGARGIGRTFVACRPSVLPVLSCEDPGVKPTTTVQAADSADQVLEGFSHYVTNEGFCGAEWKRIPRSSTSRLR